MFKKKLVGFLVLSILNVCFVSTGFANGNEAKKAKLAEETKAGIQRLGTGKDAKVQVKLYGKTKVKGYVAEADNDSFVVVDEKTGARTEISYSNAKQVKGNNLGTGAKIAIGVAILVGITLLVALSLKG